MELAKCTQEEKFSSRLGKELSLTAPENVQNNLMEQLTERVEMKETSNKKGRKRTEKVYSQQRRSLLSNVSTSDTFFGLFIAYNKESEHFYIIPLL
jgi:hypothetical protein